MCNCLAYIQTFNPFLCLISSFSIDLDVVVTMEFDHELGEAHHGAQIMQKQYSGAGDQSYQRETDNDELIRLGKTPVLKVRTQCHHYIFVKSDKASTLAQFWVYVDYEF